MAIKNRIGLRVPDQSPATEKAFYMNERETSEWVERLPLANIGETSRKLFNSLRDFNKTLIPYKKRLLCTEEFRDPISYVASNLSKHYVDVGFPLSEKAHKIAILNRELHSGMATTYKCVIIDIVLATQGKLDQKLLTTAIHRAISYLSKVMLLSAQVYDSYPKRIWLELHVLHRLACRYNLQSIKIKDLLEQHGKSSSIDEAYRRSVLFCLTSPYKIRQRENTRIFDALLEWSQYSRFYTFDEAPPETSIFVRQDSDQHPSHGSLTTDADTRHLLKMDASELINKLREQFDDHPNVDSLWGIESLDKNLLRQLIQLWSNEQKRTFVRTKLNFELRIAVGLSNIFQLIMTGAEENETNQDKGQDAEATWIDKKFAEGGILEISSRFTLEPIELQNSAAARRGDFEEFGPNSRDITEPEMAPSIWEKSEQLDGKDNTFLFHTLNESAGGYCISWEGKHIPKILVGELIGVQSSMANHQFGVGLVRWMKSNPHESMQVGLQMIAPNAIAVTAKHEDQAKGQTHECLLLPEVGTSGQPTSFICPSFPFNVGDLLIIDDKKSTREVKLTRLLESSGAISQFQFVYLDNPELQDKDETFEGDDDDIQDDSEFDNLWTTL